MAERIADTLILVFTYGVSLRQWQETGMLGREWALYKALLPYYGKLLLVTYGGSDDEQVLESVVSGAEREQVGLICNARGLPNAQYVNELPALCHARAGRGSVIVKSNQMAGGGVAVKLVEFLRAAGRPAALIARGGYLWTRFVAHQEGPHSQAAHDSAARERFLCQAADMVVGTTTEMVEDLSWRYGLDPLHTAVIPNYVLVDDPARGAGERLPGLILYAGQLVARKRVNVLIEALALLSPERRAKVSMEVIGDGPEKDALEQLAKSLGAPVVFRSRVPHHQLLHRMREAALYVQASELEGHPKTVLEAMASGAAVVVADAPGLGEVVTHGVTGLRVTPDARSFAHAIEELLNDQEWRDMMGSAAARATRASFGLDVILPQEVVVHRAAVEQARRRAAMGEDEARVA